MEIVKLYDLVQEVRGKYFTRYYPTGKKAGFPEKGKSGLPYRHLPKLFFEALEESGSLLDFPAGIIENMLAERRVLNEKFFQRAGTNTLADGSSDLRRHASVLLHCFSILLGREIAAFETKGGTVYQGDAPTHGGQKQADKDIPKTVLTALLEDEKPSIKRLEILMSAAATMEAIGLFPTVEQCKELLARH